VGEDVESEAYNACSGMPRFGHLGLLDEIQLKHLMALLLDPSRRSTSSGDEPFQARVRAVLGAPRPPA